MYSVTSVQVDFLDTTFWDLISDAEKEEVTFSRIMAESVKGAYDFKLNFKSIRIYSFIFFDYLELFFKFNLL